MGSIATFEDRWSSVSIQNDSKCVWTIDDPQVMNRISNVKCGELISSEAFKMADLNWNIELYPNGHNKNTKGSFDVYLKLKTLPSSFKEIIIQRSIISSQTKSSCTNLSKYTKNSMRWGWPVNTLTLKEIKRSNVQSLTFVIEIKIMRIILKDESIHYQLPFQYKKMQQLKWKLDPHTLQILKKSIHGKAVFSPVCDSMWTIRIQPNGWKTNKGKGKCSISVVLCGLPPKVSKLRVAIELYVKQFQFKLTKCRTLTYESDYAHFLVGAF